MESGVGYVQKNFLHGLELTDFSTIHAAVQVWLDTIANVCASMAKRNSDPCVDLLAQERAVRIWDRPTRTPTTLHTLRPVSRPASSASPSIPTSIPSPAAYAHCRLDGQSLSRTGSASTSTTSSSPVTRGHAMVAAPRTSRSRTTPRSLIAQRSRAREQRLMMHFSALSPDATAYYVGLEQHRLNARHHVRKILALAEIYPADAVARAISDGLAFQAFKVPSTSPTSWRPGPGAA